MQLPLAKNKFILASVFLYFLSLVIAKFDVGFNYCWLNLIIYFLSAGIIVFWYLRKTVDFKKIIHLPKKEKITFIIVLGIAVFISLLFIKKYPFVNVGDGIRDAGLDGMNIYNGKIKNFFGYDVHYGSHGNIIPLFVSLFYPFFGNSALVYRFPSAIIFCLDVMLIYILLRLLTKRSIAVVGSMFYLLLPLHIFMARIELVLIFNSFWTSAIFLALYIWIKKKRKIDYIFLGTILGVASTYHTSIRVVAVLILIIVFFIEFKDKFNKNIFNIISLIIFCLVGFGPLLVNTKSEDFFQNSRSVLINKNPYIMNYSPSKNRIETIKNNYMKSLMVWFYEGTTSRYPEHKPILLPFLALFFVIGIGYAFFILKKTFYNVLILLVFLLPLTNSAMTDWINADHRLAPLLPLAAIFVSLGIYYLIKKINYKIGKILLLVVIVIYLMVQTCKFFILLPANYDFGIKDYLSMHIIYFVKDHSDYLSSKNICLLVSNKNKENLNLVHYREQYMFFLPNNFLEIKSSESISEDEAYILKGNCENYKDENKLKMNRLTINCSSKISFYCPKNWKGKIKIYYQ